MTARLSGTFFRGTDTGIEQMSNMVKIIVIGVVGAVVSFLLMLSVFWIVLKPGQEAATAEQPAESQPQEMASGQMALPPDISSQQQMQQRVPGGEVLAFADVLGENIPLETSVDGYGWARWGMNLTVCQNRGGAMTE